MIFIIDSIISEIAVIYYRRHRFTNVDSKNLFRYADPLNNVTDPRGTI